MFQTLNCIRMGEVLLDENLQLFILCNNCNTDLRNIQDFRKHLEKCEGLENLFKEGQQFKYNTDKSTQLFGKTIKGIKEFLIYDYNDVEISYLKTEDNFIDLINIEEELLDPKWYSDLNSEVSNNNPHQKSAKQYDELVEAVTPFVQFKENVKTNNNNGETNLGTEIKTSTAKTSEKSIKNVKFDLSANKTKIIHKRKLSMPKSMPIQLALPQQGHTTTISASPNPTQTTIQVNKTLTSKRRKTQPTATNVPTKPLETHQIPLHTNSTIRPKVNNKSTTAPTITTNILLNPMATKPLVIPTTATIIPREPTKEKQTAQILNKLQNLGLQIKRTQPLPPPIAPAPATNKTDTKTLEILQKLQSKGMKVKILNKQQTTADATLLPSGLMDNLFQKPISVIRNSAANMAIKQNLNKNLIIKKVN